MPFITQGETNWKFLLIIIILAIIVGGGAFLCSLKESRYVTPSINQEQTCINSGGTVTTSLCCKSSGDFPNTCLIGACGCSQTDSHEVKTCDCGIDKCFNGITCVPKEITGDEIADWSTYKNGEYGFEIKYPWEWHIYPDWDRKGISFVSGQVSFSSFSESELEKGEGVGFYVSVLSSSDVSTSIGWINPSEITTRELIEKQREIFKDSYSGAEFKITDENLNGIPVVREEITKLIMDGKEGTVVSYYLDKDSRKFKIGYAGPINEVNKTIAITIFNQMLSTFRFIGEEKGGYIDNKKQLVLVNGKEIKINNDTEFYCYDKLCSLNDICKEESCGPYWFALTTQYYEKDSVFYASKLIYTPQ